MDRSCTLTSAPFRIWEWLVTVHRSPRHKVRIREPRALSPTAKLSLMLAFGAAVLVFVLLRFWQPDEIVVPSKRGLEDVEFVYKCERNHTFREFAQAGPRTCPTCGQPAYPLSEYEYSCETHGRFEVMFLFGVGADGKLKTTHRRLPGRDWVAVDKPLSCPRCNRVLKRLPEVPLGRPRRRLPEGG